MRRASLALAVLAARRLRRRGAPPRPRRAPGERGAGRARRGRDRARTKAREDGADAGLDGVGGAAATPRARTASSPSGRSRARGPPGSREVFAKGSHGAHPDRGARALPARARRRAGPERRGDRRRRRGARPPRPAAAGSAAARRAPRAARRGAREVPGRVLRGASARSRAASDRSSPAPRTGSTPAAVSVVVAEAADSPPPPPPARHPRSTLLVGLAALAAAAAAAIGVAGLRARLRREAAA